MSAVANLLMRIVVKGGSTIQGESTIVNFEDWIEVDDWNWALGFQTGSEGKASGERTEESVPSVLSFGKLMDRASTGMLNAMSKGDELTVTLEMADVSDEPFRLKVTLESARLNDYDANFKTDDKGVSIEESWGLDYRTIEFEYFIANEPGPQVKLERPPWASPDKPKGQGAEEEVIKYIGLLLDKKFSDRDLDDQWKKMKQAAAEKRISPDEEK
jgi:type VI protein secretion system component Hcp